MSAPCTCEDGGLVAALRKDLDRHVFVSQDAHGRLGATRGLPAVVEALLQRGFWAVMAYRVCHHARYRRRSRLLSMLSSIFHLAVVMATATEISPDAHIGAGLWIPHGGYIVIGPVRMGAHCEIFQGVTLGSRESTIPRAETAGKPTARTVPTLGDRIWVGPGAVIADRITVGDDATVGANSLVVRDVPPRGVVLGVPARLISRRGSFAQITYRGMNEDAERAAALAADPDAADPEFASGAPAGPGGRTSLTQRTGRQE
jgi:serine O-acetyltransferase